MRRKMIWVGKRAAIVLTLLLWLILVPIVWADDTDKFELGNNLLRKQNYSEALNAYEAFLKENPEHRLSPAALWTMANIHLTINQDYERAEELLHRVVKENLDTEWEISGYCRLGLCFEEQQKWEKAAETYKITMQKLSASSEDPVIQGRVRMLKRRLLSCYGEIEDYDSIIQLYQEILAENPATTSAAGDQFNLAQACLDKKELKGAAENFILVVERYPASGYAQRVHSEQADLLISQMDYDWTQYSTFQSALELSQAGQYEEALAKLDEVIKTKGNTGMAYGARFQKELIEYRKSCDAASLREKLATNDYPYGPGGVNQNQLDNLLQTIVEAQESLSSSSEGAEGYYFLMGSRYYLTQAYYCGIDSLKKAITIAPDSPNLYNILSYCYMGVQEYDEAISTLQKLIDTAPDDPNSYDSMAEAYYNKGDTTKAIQFYQNSLAIDSTFSNSHFMLGRIYKELDQKEKARKHLEKYLELDPSGFQSQNAQSLLDQLYPPPGENEP